MLFNLDSHAEIPPKSTITFDYRSASLALSQYFLLSVRSPSTLFYYYFPLESFKMNASAISRGVNYLVAPSKHRNPIVAPCAGFLTAAAPFDIVLKQLNELKLWSRQKLTANTRIQANIYAAATLNGCRQTILLKTVPYHTLEGQAEAVTRA